MTPLEVGRGQVLAYRVLANGLTREAGSSSELDVFSLGIQDTPAGSARLSLSARLAEEPPNLPSHGPLALVWSVRGAPHLHRREDLRRVAAALWPASDTDAKMRVGGAAPALEAAGVSGRDALRLTAQAWHTTLVGPMTKGEASAAVTEHLPEELSSWCESCKARHVWATLFHSAALPGGAQILPGRSRLTLTPLGEWSAPPGDPAGAAPLITDYLRLLGPATPHEVAAWIGTSPAELRAAWPGDLAAIRVEGRTAWLPQDRVPLLEGARPMNLVRLLPPYDPYLQASDRALLLPDKKHRAALWRGLLGRTGALLVRDEIAGVWQQRKAPRTKSM
jgi:DNA glycosylase AlkZ-like